ncbi:MAG: response regulator transcription factor [Chloroflexota bacterium]|nr:response regulator transcription factor [Chloroflexota bacterium]
MTQTINVLLVDDHTVVREGVRTMLSGEPDIVVVGEASSGEEALQRVHELAPHVVLMDIRMPGMSGTEAARRIMSASPTTSVIMLTMYDSDMYVVEAIQAGAAGYLTKDVSRELLCHAVRSVVAGGTMLRSGLLKRAMEGLLRSSAGKQQGADVPLVEHLTPREMEVLRLVAQGYGNKEICQELHLAEITVKKYVQNVIQKMGVSDRTHAAIRAVRLGFVE